MADTHLITFSTSLLLLFFFSTTSAMAFQQETRVLSPAIEALSNSGFSSMAAALHHISRSLDFVSKTSPLTIFAPSDSAFRRSGQPSRDLLHYHLCPLKLPINSVPTLPYGAKIATYHPRMPLVVTTDQDVLRFSFPEISINNVAVNRTPIFDSGPIAVYAIDQFFNPFFKRSRIQSPRRGPAYQVSKCEEVSYLMNRLPMLLSELDAEGYSEMSGLLKWQFAHPQDRPQLTVFAPSVDKETSKGKQLTDFREFGSFLRRHVAPCRLTWKDLWHHPTEIPIPTFLEGYTIKVTKSDSNVLLNGVPIQFHDFYATNSIAVHGLAGALNSRRTHADDLCSKFPCSEFPSIVVEHELENKYGVVVGRLKDVTHHSTVSHVKQHQNGTLSVLGSNTSVDWREVDRIIFHGSVLNDTQLSDFSKDQPQRKVGFNCKAHQSADDYRLASKALKAIGDSFMSSLFDIQLSRMAPGTVLTVLAPLEDDYRDHSWKRYYLEYYQHIIPCKVTWSDLVSVGVGTSFPTLGGDDQYQFMVVVGEANNNVLLNKVPVIYPDLYVSDTLVVHGVRSKMEPDLSALFEALDSIPPPTQDGLQVRHIWY